MEDLPAIVGCASGGGVGGFLGVKKVEVVRGSGEGRGGSCTAPGTVRRDVYMARCLVPWSVIGGMGGLSIRY